MENEMELRNKDWEHFAEHFHLMTCIISVEKKPGKGYGTIRIVQGNNAYKESVGLAAGGIDLTDIATKQFEPNHEYEYYLPKDLNFEDACYRAAVLQEPIHNYVRPTRYPFDINLFLIPLQSDDENMGYCAYSQILLPKTDSAVVSMSVSPETASDVLSACIKLRGEEDFQVVMNEVIEDIRRICQADLCCVLLMDPGKRQCSALCEAIAPGSPLRSMSGYLDEDFYDLAETWMDTIGGSYCLVIHSEKDMEYLKEKNPAWYESLKVANVDRLVIFPLMSRGHHLGYIWATNFDTENTLRIKDTLELTTYFIASEIASYKFVERLTALSRTDLLTGVLNRNEMNNRVSNLGDSVKENKGNYGIVFVDMNGLKYVNDNQGHEAGDQLLKNAAMILQSTFIGDEIFRAGGDEFMILLKDTSPEDMQMKIDEIKMKEEMFENVSFSAGYSFFEDGRSIRDALAQADELMYKDKDNYYHSHPERSR